MLLELKTHNTADDSDMGSIGLEVFIVREIARPHGSDVTVSSDALGGTACDIHSPIISPSP